MPEPGDSSDPSGMVRAAGGVVWRPGPSQQPEVLIVHRPKYDDWSLPKGKCDPGESGEDCALREVEEETGLRRVLGPELPGTSYTNSKGRPKEVRYWVMTSDPTAADFVANDEVDEIRWRTAANARTWLSYQRDRDVVESFALGRDG
jgi:8-oxo-dGTP pyrophosphatase MutT (NUDIX family)